MRTPRRIVLIVLALVAGMGGLVGAAAPAGAATTAGSEEVEFLRLTNEARAAAGTPALADDIAAREVARNWARTLADSGTLRHNPNVAAEVSQFVTRDWTVIGENVGRGPNVQPIQDAFMASTGHRNNILGDFNRVGIGAARDAGGQLWVTLVFIKGPPMSVVPASTWAPFGSPYGFAEQQYADFLGRPGDAGGVDHWATMLRAGRLSTAAEVESFLRSPEFGGVMAPVVRLYFGAFARIPDQPGLQSWLDTRRRGSSPATIADAFASSPEFRGRYDQYGNRQFVDALYRTVFGRPADAGALDHWGGGLDAGSFGRGGVLLGVTSSVEFQLVAASEVSTTMAYVGLLRRSPDSSGFAYWVGQLDARRPVTELLGSVLTSAEYRGRF